VAEGIAAAAAQVGQPQGLAGKCGRSRPSAASTGW